MEPPGTFAVVMSSSPGYESDNSMSELALQAAAQASSLSLLTSYLSSAIQILK